MTSIPQQKHILIVLQIRICLFMITRNTYHLQGWRLPYTERMEERIPRIGVSGFYKNLKTQKQNKT